MDPDQIGAVCPGSTLFASILKLVIIIWQLSAADDLSRRHFSDAFFLSALRVNLIYMDRMLLNLTFVCNKRIKHSFTYINVCQARV